MRHDFATGCTPPREFFIADLHFGDERVATQRRLLLQDGQGHDTEIARRWNATVAANDTVYVLGDIGAHRHAIAKLRNLRGNKHLIAGNADNLAAIHQANLFASISVARWLPGLLLTHIPVHESQLRPGMTNLHGHLHAKAVSDNRYLCVSVEQIGLAPISLEALVARRKGYAAVGRARSSAEIEGGPGAR